MEFAGSNSGAVQGAVPQDRRLRRLQVRGVTIFSRHNALTRHALTQLSQWLLEEDGLLVQPQQ